jgi:hypothetical protein
MPMPNVYILVKKWVLTLQPGSNYNDIVAGNVGDNKAYCMVALDTNTAAHA